MERYNTRGGQNSRRAMLLPSCVGLMPTGSVIADRPGHSNAQGATRLTRRARTAWYADHHVG